MVLEEIVKWILEHVTALLDIHGLRLGLLAGLLIAGYHMRHIFHFLQRALGVLKISTGVLLVIGVVFVAALSFGIVDVSGNVQTLLDGLDGVVSDIVDVVDI